MTVGVVDHLKVINIEDQYAEGSIAAYRLAELFLKTPHAKTTIKDTGERVDCRQVLQMTMGLGVIQSQSQPLNEQVDSTEMVGIKFLFRRQNDRTNRYIFIDDRQDNYFTGPKIDHDGLD